MVNKKLTFHHERINESLRTMNCNFSVSTEQQDSSIHGKDKWAVVIQNNQSKQKEPIYTSYTMKKDETIGYLEGLKDAVDIFKIKECPIRKD